MTTWRTRPERPGDEAAIRAVLLGAFPTAEEADLVESLRADPGAWIDGLSIVGALEEEGGGEILAHALLTRCLVGGEPALALAPCAVLPGAQGRGGGSAVIRAVLEAARARGEQLVVVLGHADYYPRFGFTPASAAGVSAPFEAPEEAFRVLALDPGRPMPRGPVVYPHAFGV